VGRIGAERGAGPADDGPDVGRGGAGRAPSGGRGTPVGPGDEAGGATGPVVDGAGAEGAVGRIGPELPTPSPGGADLAPARGAVSTGIGAAVLWASDREEAGAWTPEAPGLWERSVRLSGAVRPGVTGLGASTPGAGLAVVGADVEGSCAAGARGAAGGRVSAGATGRRVSAEGRTTAGGAAAGATDAVAGRLLTTGRPPRPSAGRSSATAGVADSSSGWTSRRSPSRSALRRTRSACWSSMLEEWLLTPIPNAMQRSSASLLVSPSSRPSS
jgi:hypothetical protein